MEIQSLGVLCTWESGNPDEESASFGLAEYAVTNSGERVVLHNDRGWTAGRLYRMGTPPVNYWMSGVILDDLIASTHSTLLPDEDDDDHDWVRLVYLLEAQGIGTTVEYLRSVPYLFEVSSNLVPMLTPGEADRLPVLVDWSTIER